MDDITVKQEQNKTIVAFVLGLIIGGLLFWIFSPSNDTKVVVEDADTETMETMEESKGVVSPGSGSFEVADQPAGEVVTLAVTAYPAQSGWVVVREYIDGVAGNILGASRYNTEDGLLPTEVELLRGTEAGNMYRLSFFTEDGDMEFDTGIDIEVEGGAAVFTAQ